MRIRAVNVTRVYPQTCVKQIIKCTEVDKGIKLRMSAHTFMKAL